MGRPKTDRKVTRISISLDDRDYQALREIAEINDVSAAWLVRRAVADFLKTNTTGQGALPAKVATR